MNVYGGEIIHVKGKSCTSNHVPSNPFESNAWGHSYVLVLPDGGYNSFCNDATTTFARTVDQRISHVPMKATWEPVTILVSGIPKGG